MAGWDPSCLEALYACPSVYAHASQGRWSHVVFQLGKNVGKIDRGKDCLDVVVEFLCQLGSRVY